MGPAGNGGAFLKKRNPASGCKSWLYGKMFHQHHWLYGLSNYTKPGVRLQVMNVSPKVAAVNFTFVYTFT